MNNLNLKQDVKISRKEKYINIIFDLIFAHIFFTFPIL